MATPKTVTLIDPNGGKVNVSHPADVTNLVFGSGYKVDGSKTPDQAIAYLAGPDVIADVEKATDSKKA